MSFTGTVRAALTRTLAIALVLLTVLLPGLPSAAPSGTALSSDESALSGDQWTAIEAVIAEQLAALQAGDGGKAFAHAAPGIRQQFGNAGNFLLVRTAYGALIAARYSEFLDGAVIEGRVIQPMRLIGSDNSVRVALYTMEKQPDGSWKIAGCVLAPSTVQAA